jgi:hypothetical protein
MDQISRRHSQLDRTLLCLQFAGKDLKSNELLVQNTRSCSDYKESEHDLISLSEHDFFGKPVSTFPNHALVRRGGLEARLLKRM